MIHQVNLYKAEFKPEKLWCSSQQMLIGWCLLVVVYAGATFSMESWSTTRANNSALGQQRTQVLENQIKVMEVTLSRRTRDERLARNNDRLKQQIIDGADLVRFLESRQLTFNGDVPLSAMLTGFARQTGSGMWLNQIVIEDDTMDILGVVDHADRIPLYLKRLGNEQAFEGRHFTALNLQTVSNDASATLAFKLSSRPNLVIAAEEGP